MDEQNENTFELSQQDIDIIGEVNNISMGSAAMSPLFSELKSSSI